MTYKVKKEHIHIYKTYVSFKSYLKFFKLTDPFPYSKSVQFFLERNAITLNEVLRVKTYLKQNLTPITINN